MSAHVRRFPHEPTVDVENTIAWLTTSDFVQVETRGPEGMGFQSAVFERPDGVRVRLGTERGQWMADVSVPEWGRWFDLDVIVQAQSGAPRWDLWVGSDRPRQLPPGIRWSEAVPNALSWATATPDSAHLLEQLQRERGALHLAAMSEHVPGRGRAPALLSRPSFQYLLMAVGLLLIFLFLAIVLPDGSWRDALPTPLIMSGTFVVLALGRFCLELRKR